MKKILTLVFLFSTHFFAFSKDDPKQEINSPVKSAIVYLDGAELTHTAQVNLSTGRNKIIFTGLSTKLVSKSVQATASGDVSILSVSDQVNYLAKQNENARIKQLKDSSDMLDENFWLLNNDKDAFEAEKKMVMANESIGGQNTGVPLTALKPAADFFRSRIMEINNEIYKIEKKQKKIKESLTRLAQELNELNAKFNSPTSEITILLFANAKSASTIELKYLVRSAGWAPIYDLKAEDITKPIELKYRANVFNNTGTDWNEIKIKLSTADPMQSAAQPQLSTWYLDYENYTYSNQNLSYDYDKRNIDSENNSDGVQKDINSVLSTQPGVMQGDVNIRGGRQGDQKYYYENGKQISDKSKMTVKDKVKYEEIQVSELSAEFDIKNPYTIPSDAKPYLVDVTTYTLPAAYQHFCAPKTDRDAFLLARITGWEDLNLVEGPANVYYAGTYVGRSYINTQSTDDTLNLSLGRDRKILITRTKQKDLTSTKYIGASKKETYAFEIAVKNNGKAPVNIEVNDQLPVSKQGDITVEAIELSKAEQDAITGKLKWNLTLQPDELKKIKLEFSIKYPKNKSIAKKKFRTVSAPSF